MKKTIIALLVALPLLVFAQPDTSLAPTRVRVNPTVACNGRDFFVVWEENVIPFIFPQSGHPVTIRAARIRGSDGALLDRRPISLPASGSSRAPAVASDGENFLVVWQDFSKDRRPVGRPCLFNSDVLAARVRARDGAVLDTIPITVSAGERGQGSPAVAFGNDRYLVVWKDSRTSDCVETDLYGARIDPRSGQVADPEGFPVSQMPGSEEAPAIAYDGNNYFVVWQIFEPTPNLGAHIFGTRITGDPFEVLDVPAIPICQAPGWHQNPQIVFTTNLFWLAWEGFRDERALSYGEADIYLARVFATGSDVTYDAGGFLAVQGRTAAGSPRLAMRASNVLLVWQSDAVYGMTLGSDLPQVDSDTVQVLRYAAQPSVAANRRQFLLTWARDGKIFATRLNSNTLRPIDRRPTHVAPVPGHASDSSGSAVDSRLDALDELRFWPLLFP